MKSIPFIAGLTLIVGSASSIWAGDSGGGPPTFSRDVAPIFQARCQACHRPGEAAPMSLLTYADTRPWVKSIRKNVSDRTMPPWHADPAIGKWKNDRRLSDEEMHTITAWADAGAPEGNPADLPAPREWADGWIIGQPDMIFTLPQEQVLPPDLVDQYRYLAVPMGLKEDTWVEAIEVRPGNREVVHHVNVFETSGLNTPDMRAAIAAASEANKDADGKTRRMSGQGFGPQGEPKGRVAGFLPGGLPYALAEGEGVLLPAGSALMLQVHYHKESGMEARDRTSIGVRLCKKPPVRRLHGGAVENCRFKIPAGDANHEVEAELQIAEDIHVTALSPHMHLRGKDFKAWAELPDGKRVEILNVPH
ncbi:cytochrome c, partial [Candidatus Sumerlaeota bacterium]|nr:cytochrome c [Candidatus Sumerlaeota bacterium]